MNIFIIAGSAFNIIQHHIQQQGSVPVCSLKGFTIGPSIGRIMCGSISVGQLMQCHDSEHPDSVSDLLANCLSNRYLCIKTIHSELYSQ